MKWTSSQSRRWFSRFAWGVLLYNIPVILWGAYVRVSFSGDGCGANWPTCNGQFLPQKMAAPMAIEFTHRLMTSGDIAAVLALVLWAFLAFPKNDAVRRYAVLSAIFLFIEALLGAGLVLFRLVAKNQSAGRVWYLGAHLTNTMLLLAALSITAWLAQTGVKRLHLRQAPGRLLICAVITVFVSITGTITALGDTLFPAASLGAGMQQDFTATSSLLLRLRVVHPLIAVAGALYLIWTAAALLQRPNPSTGFLKSGAAVIAATVVQVAAGMVNLVLLAPLAMQLIHLFLADLVWISVVLLTVETAASVAAKANVEDYCPAASV